MYLFGLREGHVARLLASDLTGLGFDLLGSNTSFLQQVELDNQRMLAKECKDIQKSNSMLDWRVEFRQPEEN